MSVNFTKSSGIENPIKMGPFEQMAADCTMQ